MIKYYPGATKNALSFLEPALSTTMTIVARYLDHFCTDGYLADRPFAYNERASLSLLTGGIWQSDPKNLVLEEYTSSKISGDLPYRGRDDLWFRADDKTCYAEAKQQWICTRAPANGLEIAKQTLVSEFRSASVNRRFVDHSLGILFLIPQLSSNQRAAPRDFLESYYTALDGELESFAVAQGLQIIRGTFLEERFVQPEAFCYPGKCGDVSYPGFDIIACTGSKE